MTTEAPLLQIGKLSKSYDRERPWPFRTGSGKPIVQELDLKIWRGETVALVGESGCGKTTTAKCVARILRPSAGSIIFDGRDISQIDEREMRPLRRKLQYIFQDAYASLNPRMNAAQLLAEPLRNFAFPRTQERQRIAELLEQVGLPPDSASKYPHQFSGGQRQRIGIARALAMKPDLIICDEPVSALDVSVQAQILNLLQDLQKTHGLTYLFISHDLGVVKHISNRVAVMQSGRIVETGLTAQVFAQPAHPYTRRLLAARPHFPGRPKAVDEGEITMTKKVNGVRA